MLFLSSVVVFCHFFFGGGGGGVWGWGQKINFFEEKTIRNTICVEKSMDPDQGPYCL